AKTGTFFLEGKDLSYGFFINHTGFPEHLYSGGRIDRDVLLYTRSSGGHSSVATPPGEDTQGAQRLFSYHQFSPEISFFGTGDYREPTVHAETVRGDRLTRLLYAGHEILPQKPKIDGMPSLSGGETLRLHLADPDGGLAADLYYTVYDDCSVVARRAVYHNRGAERLILHRAWSFAMGLCGSDYEALTLPGNWASERSVERAPLRRGVFSVDSKRTSSSATLNPFLAVVSPDATEDAGRAWGFSLVYSSSFVLKAEVASTGETVVSGGINDFDFSWVLEPGERLETPECVIAVSEEGLGGMSRALHDAWREHLIPAKWAKTPRPVLINNWEATYFGFDFDRLKAIIDAVADTGIDTFVLDDGWFGKRDNDRSGLGDWTVNENKLKGGLGALIDYLKTKGMKFGLWFEPEMVSEDSDLFRAHPDYAIGLPDRARCYSRHQLMLDLTRAEVRDYIVDSVNRILDAYDISYVKWDYNRNVTDSYSIGLPPERQSEFAHRYALGLYEIFDRIVDAHPDVFFEGCASGGARFDPGVLAYFPQIWTSDNSDAEDRTAIQYGTSIVYPLSTMSCHVSICPNHQTGRTTSFATRADVAHLGATGYELDATVMTDEERAAVRAQIEDYRAMEDLVLSGDAYRLGSPDDNVFGVMLVSRDKSRARMTCYRRLGGPRHGDPVRLCARGLDPAKRYYVPELGLILGGRTLARVGPVPTFPRGDFGTFVCHFEEK
ncbi:MAG: alpha-galactosidase, partial [Clostridia bacterium]|nr:alpha-galactosidase [Clostridia bacterium]